MVDVEVLDGVSAVALRDRVFAVYCDAFGPQDEQRWVDELWDRHRCRPGYRLVVAFEAEELVGFGWGYTGERGQFWADQMATALGPAAASWVGGHFEFVELGVKLSARGRGIGARVHDAMLEGLPHTRAVLCTSTLPDDPAVRLYNSRGWRQIGLMSDDVQVMGLPLPAR